MVLPLALAFGVVSGLGAAAGLYGAAAVGFFAAVFGSTKVQVSGATAPVAVAMSFVVAHYADSGPEALTIIVLAGLIQILLGVLRVGSLVAYTPYSVVSGFTSGVAIIIIAMQVLPFMGGALETGRPLDSVGSWGSALDDMNLSAFAAAVVTVLVCGAWPRRLRDYVPSTTAALVIGTVISALWLKDAPRIADAVDSLPDFWDLDLSGGSLAGAVQPAVMVALIGTLNSLLNAMAADSLTGHRHKPNRELIGAGLGNTVAGLFGGLPGGGAPTATEANIRRGARHPGLGGDGCHRARGAGRCSRALHRRDPAGRARRHPAVDRLRSDRLALHHAPPQGPAGACPGHGSDAGSDGVLRPGTAQVHCEDPTCGRALSASEGPRGWVVTDQVRISARSTGCTGWS